MTGRFRIRHLDYGGGLFSRGPVVRYLRQDDVAKALRGAASEMAEMMIEKGKDPDCSTLPFRSVQELLRDLAESFEEA